MYSNSTKQMHIKLLIQGKHKEENNTKTKVPKSYSFRVWEITQKQIRCIVKLMSWISKQLSKEKKKKVHESSKRKDSRFIKK